MAGKDDGLVALVQGKGGAERGSAKGSELKELAALCVKGIDKPNRWITALASAGTLDRDGEIIEPEAFRKWLPVYMKNPIVLTSHMHRLQAGNSSVVGNVVDARIDKKGYGLLSNFTTLHPWPRNTGSFTARKSKGPSVSAS